MSARFESVLARCREENVHFLRLQFTDIDGMIKNVEVLSTLRPYCSASLDDSAMDARLDTGGWPTLTRRGLSPRKIRRGYRGARLPGAVGMRIYPPEHTAELRRVCSECDVLMILDEIAVGFGRTLRMFASELAGVVPDMMCVEKGLTGGTLIPSLTK